MQQRINIRVIIVSVLFLLAAPAWAELKIGDKAPDFKLLGSDGKFHALADYKGKKPVVLAFFPKAYTGGCTAECKALRDADKEIRKFNVAYFMASVDKPEDNKGFAEQNHATFPILSDTDKSVSKAYGALSVWGVDNRWTFYIDKQGIIQKIDRNVNPKTAGAVLVKNLDALGYGR